jgi:hypothetical protein
MIHRRICLCFLRHATPGRVTTEQLDGALLSRFRRLYAGCILSVMVCTQTFREARRSTRVPLKVIIAIEGGAESRTFEGETIMVNLHGASIATAIGLSRGMRISIRVYLTDKRASARVVYIDPENPLHCGIELAEPRNIWGVPLPPDDWEEKGTV